MEISASQVKELRDKTGAGFMECKAALMETNGNVDQAVTVLRTKGQAKAEKRASRSTSQGVIGHYVHQGGQVAVIVEVNCETDFVARTDDFQALVKEIAMHIAAANPTCVRREEVAADDLETEQTIYRKQFENSDKPAHIIEKIVEGKVNSYYEQVVLLDQPSIRDPKITIGSMVTAAVAKLGENITVARFARFKVGDSAD
jgi:elongation factor Ts